jgi:hypothetical protein
MKATEVECVGKLECVSKFCFLRGYNRFQGELRRLKELEYGVFGASSENWH